MRKIFFAAVLLVQSFAFAGEKVLQCTADFSALDPRASKISVLLEKNDAKIRSVVTLFAGVENANEDVKVRELSIREGLDFSIDNDAALDAMNEGERALGHLEALKKELKTEIHIPFEAKDVATVRIYDLDGEALTNMMGGTILLEAFGKDGKLLGRVFRSVLANECI